MWRTFIILMMVVSSASSSFPQSPNTQARMFTLKGSVVDRKGNPVGFALVYLKDTRSRLFRMKHAERDGHFTFTLLNAQLDYEIYAEWDDLVSEKVFVSGSQKAPDVMVTLKVTGKQENH